jgi:hypothetical protein
MGLMAAMPNLWTAVGAAAQVGAVTITLLATGNSTVQLAAVGYAVAAGCCFGN